MQVEIVHAGKVRRAKLYYLRDKVGKGAKVKELVGGKIAQALAARNAAAAANAAAKEEAVHAAAVAEHEAAKAAAKK